MGYRPFSNRGDWQKPPLEFWLGAGKEPRFRPQMKYGYNTGLTSAGFQDLWTPGGTLSYLTSAEPMLIASTSGSDDGDPEGTGAHKVVVEGVDANYNLISEEITLNGTSDVTTTNSYLRVFRMYVTDVGSGSYNVGTITATAQTAATLQAQIDAQVGETLMAMATIPNGFYAYVTHIYVAAVSLDTVIVDLVERTENEAFRVAYRMNVPTASPVVVDFMPFGAPILMPPKTDLVIRGLKVGGGTTLLSGSFSFYLVDEREFT